MNFLPFFCASPIGLVIWFALALIFTPLVLSLCRITPTQIDRIPIGVSFIVTVLWGIALFSLPEYIVITMPLGAVLMGVNCALYGYTKTLNDSGRDENAT